MMFKNVISMGHLNIKLVLYVYFRWTPPPFTRIQHPKLCMSRQDFHEVYNLSLDGVENPHLMDVTEKDWLSVFTVLRTKGQKVKLRTIRSELYDGFMMLYQMVYQELPINGECAAWFAKAFAFENCQRADLSLDKSKFRVAWAVVAEKSVTRLGAHKQGLSNKMSRVMTHMTEGKTVCKSVLVAQTSKASMYTSNSRDVELAQIMRSDVQAKVRQLESEIGQISKEMQQAQVEVEVQSKADTFLKQLREAREELATREASGNVPLERMVMLQAVISANLQVLGVLGVAEGGTSENNDVAAIQVDLQTPRRYCCSSYFVFEQFC